MNTQNNEIKDFVNNIVQQITKETASTFDKMNKQIEQQSPKNETGFYEYVVQRGATLGAISKAYKCKVSDIKTANNLKNDIIYVGQKLKIPK